MKCVKLLKCEKLALVKWVVTFFVLEENHIVLFFI